MLPITLTGDRRRWIALVVVCLGQLMVILDTTIVNVALPAIQRDLRFSQPDLTWVVDAYLITYGSFLLLGGRLGDLVGRKRVFLGGVLVFTVASGLCSLAEDQGVLIAARFLQGVGGAFASAVIIALIVTEFERPLERAKAMSVYTFVVSGGASFGLLAGGALTQAVDWHWIFLINLPIGLITLLLGGALIRENDGLGLGRGVDALGSILVTVALMLAVYAIVKATDHGWLSAHTLGFGGAALALLTAFVALETRLANPIMPLWILRLRGLTGSSVVRAFLITGAFASFFLGTLYLQRVLGYDAIHTGLAFLPQTLAVGLLSLGITARVMQSLGPKRTLLPGIALTFAGLVLLSRAGEHTAYFPGVFVPFVLLGVGLGSSFLPLLTIAMEEVPSRDAGLASGIVNTSMQISAALGLAALGSIATDHTRALTSQGEGPASALTGGYQLAFTIAAATVAACLLIAVVVLRPPRAQQEPVRAGKPDPAPLRS